MRVIAGSARGRHLRAVASSRPTADLIKGVIFSMLEALAYKRGFEPDDDGHLAAALALRRVQAPIDLVLVDPPYAEHGALRSAADQLTAAELLRPSSVVVLEQPAEAQPFNAVGPLELHATRVHGRTRVSLFAT